MEENTVVRRNLAAAIRGLAWYGMQEGIFNHCSALSRSKDGNRDLILFSPFGPLWQDVTPENLIGVDPSSGKVVEGEGNLLGAAACIHTAIYNSRPDVRAIMHVHPTYASSLSCLKENRMVMLHQLSLRFYDDVSYDDYKCFDADTKTEGKMMAESLGGSKRVLMMGNHGVVTVGPTVAVAFDLMHGFESACKTQVLAMSTGKEMNILPDKIAQEVKANYEGTLISDAQVHLDAVNQHLDKVSKS